MPAGSRRFVKLNCDVTCSGSGSLWRGLRVEAAAAVAAGAGDPDPPGLPGGPCCCALLSGCKQNGNGLVASDHVYCDMYCAVGL